MQRRAFLAGFLASAALPSLAKAAPQRFAWEDPRSVYGTAPAAGRWFLVEGFDQFGKPLRELVPFPGASENMFSVVSSTMELH